MNDLQSLPLFFISFFLSFLFSEPDTDDIVSEHRENRDSSAEAAKCFSGLNTDSVAPEPVCESYSLDMAIAAVKNGEVR